MNITSTEALSANVFQASNEEYKKGVLLNREKLADSIHHEITSRGLKLDVVIDKEADDIDEIFLSKGVSIPPDEILEAVKRSNVRIPIKSRELFNEAKLPLPELLKVLHYYASNKVAKRNNMRLTRILDESALLGLGLLVEEWVSEYITNSDLFTEDPLQSEFDEDRSSGSPGESESE